MRRTPRGLSPEAEVGLAGELAFLNLLLEAGMNALSAVESWLGPGQGIQDFEIGSGSVEVKATLSGNASFPAKIGSLEQLDDSFRSPLFLAGVRFVQGGAGSTLGDMAQALSEKLAATPGAAADFSDRLVAAGFPPAHYGRYTRKFSPDSVRVLEVDDFPRFIPGNVADAIRKVKYELDLDRLPGEGVSVGDVIERLGVA